MTNFYQDPFFSALVALSIAYIAQLVQALRPYQITIVQAGETFTPAPKAQPLGNSGFMPLKSASTLAEARQLPDEETLARRERIRQTLERNRSENQTPPSDRANEEFAMALDKVFLEDRSKPRTRKQRKSSF